MTQENSNLFTLAQFLAFASNQTCPHEEELEKVKEELQVLRNSKRPWAFVQFRSSRYPIHTPEEGKKIIREQYPHLDFDSLENSEKLIQHQAKELSETLEAYRKMCGQNIRLEFRIEAKDKAISDLEVRNEYLEKRNLTWEEDFKKLSRHSDEKDSLISEYENRVRNYMGQLDVLNDRYHEYVNRSLIRFTAEKDKVLFLQRRLCQFELRNSFLERPGIHDPEIILIKDSSPPTHDIKILKQVLLKADLNEELLKEKLPLPWESWMGKIEWTNSLPAQPYLKRRDALEKLERELEHKKTLIQQGFLWLSNPEEFSPPLGPSFPDWKQKENLLKELKEFLSLLDPGRVFKNVQELEEKLRLKPRWWELEYCLVNRGPPESKLPPPVFPAARGPDDPEGEDIPHSLEFPKGRLRS